MVSAHFFFLSFLTAPERPRHLTETGLSANQGLIPILKESHDASSNWIIQEDLIWLIY